MMRSRTYVAACLSSALALQPLAAQQVEHGITVQRGWLNTRLPVEPMDVRNTAGDQIKGAQRIGITVFNVAFPDEFKLVAKSHGASLNLISSRSSTMHTHLTGVDLAARQKIADEVYSDFVTQLRAAGFEVVDQRSLIAASPELASWAGQPSGAQGRFGTYVAPSGMQVRFMPGDTAQRATSGMFGQQMVAFRALDRTPAYIRSPNVARDANVTPLAVTKVVD